VDDFLNIKVPPDFFLFNQYRKNPIHGIGDDW